MTVRDTEYYPAYCDRIPIGDNSVFLQNRNENKTHRVASLEADLLASLSGCLTLRDHLTTLASSDLADISNVDVDRLYGLVERWVRDGLLRPRRLLAAALDPGHATEHPDQSPSATENEVMLSCITRDRPASFAGWLDDFCRPGETLFSRIVVVDDSRDRDSIESNRRTAASAESAGLHVDYISPQERERRVSLVIKRIAEKGVPSAIVEFGLTGVGAPESVSTFGSTRNITLLMGAGRRIVASDDDIRRRFAHIKSSDDKSVVFETSMHDLRFFPSMADIENALYPAEDDSIDKLIEPLGHSTTVFGNRVDMSSISSKAAWLLETGRPTIIAASAGCYGARQFAIPLRTFLFRMEHLNETIHHEYGFESVRRQALCIRQTTALTLDVGDMFSTALCSLDATRELLPFFVWGRREDICFRMVQKMLYPAGLFGSVPFSAFHDPSPKAPFSESLLGTHTIDLGTYNQAILKGLSIDLLREPGPRRVGELAGRFRDVGRMSSASFREYLRLVQVAQLEMLQRILKTELDLYNAEPVWWADELGAYISYMDREIADPDSVVALELRSPERSIAESLAIHQHFYAQWADLLEAWPIMWEAARAINEEDGWGTPPS